MQNKYVHHVSFLLWSKKNQQILGFYALDFDQQGYVGLDALFIEAEFIGTDLGSLLMLAAQKKPI